MRLTMKNHSSNTYRASLIRQDNNCLLIFISLSEKITSLILYQVLRTKARKIAVEIPLFRLAKGIKSETKGE